jgi:hypothetical protein
MEINTANSVMNRSNPADPFLHLESHIFTFLLS